MVMKQPHFSEDAAAGVPMTHINGKFLNCEAVKARRARQRFFCPSMFFSRIWFEMF
jgi:hypothetical protein